LVGSISFAELVCGRGVLLYELVSGGRILLCEAFAENGVLFRKLVAIDFDEAVQGDPNRFEERERFGKNLASELSNGIRD